MRSEVDFWTRVLLTPALIVDNERQNTGETQMALDHDVHLPFPLRLVSVVGYGFHGWHVLHDHDSQLVRCPVEQVRLDFNVLAQEVEAKIFEVLDVEDHSLIGRRRHKTIWPVSLVERPELVNGFAVEYEPLDSINDLALNSPEPGV